MSKPKAVEIVKEKLWITYDASGKKTGTLSKSDQFVHLVVDGSKTTYDIDTIEEHFDFKKKTENFVSDENNVFGYPVPKYSVYNKKEIDNLPCYTKNETSKVYYAAGFYGINFPDGGWMGSFCPKLSTLKKYEFIGPFKAEYDMQIALQRKQKSV